MGTKHEDRHHRIMIWYDMYRNELMKTDHRSQSLAIYKLLCTPGRTRSSFYIEL